MRLIMKRNETVNERYKEHKFSKDDLRRINAVKKLLPFDISVMVDIGCFDGTVASALKPAQKVTVIGLELSKYAARKAKHKLDEVIQCDVEESLPLRDGCIDCIYAGEIIEHLFDLDYFVEELKRILEKKGNLVVTTPNLAGLGARFSLLLGQKPWMIEESLKKEYAGHIRYFTVPMLKEAIGNHGLIVDRVTSDGVKLGGVVVERLGGIMPELGLHIIVRGRKE